MAIVPCSHYMKGIIPHTTIETGESGNCSAAPAKRSYCERGTATPVSSGENSSITVDRSASIVPFSEMKAESDHRSLSDRLMQSLITAGLVRGVIPTSMRTGSAQQTLAFVFCTPDGDTPAGRKADL